MERSMGPTDPLFAVLAVGLALGVVHACRRWLPAPPGGGRNAAIDGLRGYLAFFVFLHHAAIWRGYLATRQWTAPPSRLFTHFGESSVTLFFMITAFLFVRKLQAARGRFAWGGFFLGRALRLVPAYALAMGLMFAVVAVESGWTLLEPKRLVAREVAQWLAFSIAGYGPVNGFGGTHLITAGVVWSLACEWHFYLALPLLGLALGRRPGALPCLAAAASLALAAWRQPHLAVMPAFAGGALAVPLAQRPGVGRLAASPAGTGLVLACVALAVLLFPTAYAAGPMLLACAFTLVAAGCSLCGALTSRVSRLLGEPTYSIYLLHGLVLYVAIHWVFGAAAVARWPAPAYCAMVLGLVPVLLALAWASYRWVEMPALGLLPGLAGRRAQATPGPERPAASL
jgi:peptidoglycan/LPS O-acetylase OafA/YrhL